MREDHVTHFTGDTMQANPAAEPVRYAENKYNPFGIEPREIRWSAGFSPLQRTNGRRRREIFCAWYA